MPDMTVATHLDPLLAELAADALARIFEAADEFRADCHRDDGGIGWLTALIANAGAVTALAGTDPTVDEVGDLAGRLWMVTQ